MMEQVNTAAAANAVATQDTENCSHAGLALFQAGSRGVRNLTIALAIGVLAGCGGGGGGGGSSSGASSGASTGTSDSTFLAGANDVFADARDGKGTDARVSSGTDVWMAVAPDGTTYLSTYGSIKTLSSDGTLTTIAGPVNGPTSQAIDGVGSDVGIGFVRAMTAGPSGEILFLDGGPRADGVSVGSIREVNASGAVKTRLQGYGTHCYGLPPFVYEGPVGDVCVPLTKGFDIDSNGNWIYSGTKSVYRYLPATETVVRIAGDESVSAGTSDGVGAAARFTSIGSLVVDRRNNDIYVTDNDALRKIKSDGTVTTMMHSTLLIVPPLAIARSGRIFQQHVAGGLYEVNTATATVDLTTTSIDPYAMAFTPDNRAVYQHGWATFWVTNQPF